MRNEYKILCQKSKVTFTKSHKSSFFMFSCVNFLEDIYYYPKNYNFVLVTLNSGLFKIVSRWLQKNSAGPYSKVQNRY